METCYFSEFVDIADLILHGDNECIALPILPFQEISRENYEEVPFSLMIGFSNLLLNLLCYLDICS